MYFHTDDPETTAPKTVRDHVLDMVNLEMDRTDDNADSPTVEDYLSDLVRYLNNQLPEGARYFEGDY